MIGNKIDEYLDAVITPENVLDLALEINAIYKTISAKTGEGIDDLFESIGRKFLNPNLDVKELIRGNNKYIKYD